MPLLIAEDLTKHFGGLIALDHVSFSVEPREILAVIGPNGAGKTTLFNVISGLLKPDGGRICFDGQNIECMKSNQIAGFGIARTFQIVRPLRNLSVIKNVLSALGTKFCGKFISSLMFFNKENFIQEARNLLKRVELDGYENELAKNLPLGLLRRLEIARALAISPLLVLLDESFSGLSHQEISSQMDLVKQLRREDKTVILIEHNMEVAMEICDRIVVLEYGKKIAEGLPMEIRNDPLVIKAYLGEEEQIA